MEYRNGYIEGLVTILGAMRSHCTRYKLISVTKSHVLDWERQGQGRMEYRNGDKCTGRWKGVAGTGTITYTDGSTYEVSV